MENASKIASVVNVEIKMLRICNRQTNRVNVVSDNPEEYFKMSIFIPFIDNLICQLNSRFDEMLKKILPGRLNIR